MSNYKGKTAKEWADLAEDLQRENQGLIALLDSPLRSGPAVAIMRELAARPELANIRGVRLREFRIERSDDMYPLHRRPYLTRAEITLEAILD